MTLQEIKTAVNQTISLQNTQQTRRKGYSKGNKPKHSPEHDNLTLLGARWLKKQGFAVVATEISAVGSREQPDVVGFRSTCSAIIEAKVSRADFLAD